MRTSDRLPEHILDQIAETLLDTDDDIYIGLREAGIDPDDADDGEDGLLTLAGTLPGLRIKQCLDCGYWVRSLKSHRKTCGQFSESETK